MAQRGIHLLAVVLATFVCVGHARAPQKIIEGEYAELAEFPYQVYLDILNGGVCGGTILDSLHILTAAHCIRPYGPLLANKNIVVITGTNDRQERSSDNVFQVVEAALHSNFNESGYLNDDIAILKVNIAGTKTTGYQWSFLDNSSAHINNFLENISETDGVDREISFNHYRQPAKLPKNDTQAYTWITVSGWGLTEKGSYSRYLKKLKQVVLSQKVVENWMHGIKYDTSRIYAWAPEGGDPCTGDSGSPLSSDDVVVGIASQGICDGGYPIVYTRVYKYLAWIKMIMQTKQSNIGSH